MDERNKGDIKECEGVRLVFCATRKDGEGSRLNGISVRVAILTTCHHVIIVVEFWNPRRAKVFPSFGSLGAPF